MYVQLARSSALMKLRLYMQVHYTVVNKFVGDKSGLRYVPKTGSDASNIWPSHMAPPPPPSLVGIQPH